MKRGLLHLAALAMWVGLVGCDQAPRRTSPPPANPDIRVETERDVKVKAPGVDVEVDRTRDPDGDRKVDVDIVPGEGVKVDVER